ncbi:MAG TPA: hypothetical protein VGB30_03425 [bacterium]|jgi:rubrerythrin
MEREKELRESLLAAVRTIDKAIGISHNAIMFYSEMAMRSDDRKTRNIYRWLTGYERKLRAKLVHKRKEFAAHPKIKGHVPNTALDQSVSKVNSAFLLKEITDGSEILHHAMVNSKKAFSFYTRKSTVTEDPTVKALLHDFADEEEKRIGFLRQQMINVEIGSNLADYTNA